MQAAWEVRTWVAVSDLFIKEYTRQFAIPSKAGRTSTVGDMLRKRRSGGITIHFG